MDMHKNLWENNEETYSHAIWLWQWIYMFHDEGKAILILRIDASTFLQLDVLALKRIFCY